MIDHNFTDAETVKALECCNTPGSCYKCPYYVINEVEYDDSCIQNLIIDIFPLINRQKAEIERLNTVHADMTESLRLAAEANKDMSTELNAMRGAANSYKMHYEAAKAEAIKEFAWRLKNRLTPYPEAPFCEMVGSLDIDALVEEMTENKR